MYGQKGQIFHQWLTNLQGVVYLQLSCASGILRLYQQQKIKVWASFVKEQKCFVNNNEFSQRYMLLLTYLALRKAKWQPWKLRERIDCVLTLRKTVRKKLFL